MSDLDTKMLALIMIGGKSTRMGGGIKSFIKFNNKNILDRIIERIEPQIKKMIINCNSKEEKLEKYQIPIIQDVKKGYLGPLAGIHSAMNWVSINEPQIEWLITIPGDTPFFPKNLVSCFKKKISSKSKIILARSNKKTHPIIGAWNLCLFSSLNNDIDEGVRKILSWAELHHIEYIDYQIKKYDPFFNINRKKDILEAAKIENNYLLKKT
tara:strand:+ start:464 stop:1096 length:633 start_codon:yes stop_codon:yes gene_type:complete